MINQYKTVKIPKIINQKPVDDMKYKHELTRKRILVVQQEHLNTFIHW